VCWGGWGTTGKTAPDDGALAQLERIDWHLLPPPRDRRLVSEELGEEEGIEISPEVPWARSAFWIVCAVLDEQRFGPRDEVMAALDGEGIETRPFFYLLHTLPMYSAANQGKAFPRGRRSGALGRESAVIGNPHAREGRLRSRSFARLEALMAWLYDVNLVKGNRRTVSLDPSVGGPKVLVEGCAEVIGEEVAENTDRTKIFVPDGLHRLKGLLGGVPTWLRALVFFTVIALFTIGRHAIWHPQTVCACVGTSDPGSYMWALAWWPHALVHGLNPFITLYQWSPTGVNVAQGASIPSAAILLAPITALFGPIFSYNILSILSCVLSAFAAYLLCRYLVKKELPSVVGGYLFGFGAYEFAQLTGHLNLTLIFLVPVMIHMALRRVNREISRRAYVIRMVLLFIIQAGLSTELLAECVGFGAVLLIAAWLLVPRRQRSLINSLVVETLIAGILALIVASPFFYYALFRGSFPKGAPNLSDLYGLDILNLVFPTYATWLGHHDFLSLGLTYNQGNVTEADGYLGAVIIIAFITWLLGDGRKRLLGRLLLIVTVVSLIVALGSHLHVAGQQTVALPFNWVRNWPIFDDIVPSRAILFTSLAVSIGVAAWLAAPTGHTWARWLFVIVGIGLIFPNLIAPLYGVPPSNPRFFSSKIYRRYLRHDETVLILPFGVNSMSGLWQAETGFYFYMPEGYVSGVVPSPFNAEPEVGQFVANAPPTAPSFEAFIHRYRISNVVVDATSAGPWPEALTQLGLRSRSIGGVLLYDVTPESRVITRRASPRQSSARSQDHPAKGQG
jgi:hypothetical protein